MARWVDATGPVGGGDALTADAGYADSLRAEAGSPTRCARRPATRMRCAGRAAPTRSPCRPGRTRWRCRRAGSPGRRHGPADRVCGRDAAARRAGGRVGVADPRGSAGRPARAGAPDPRTGAAPGPPLDALPGRVGRRPAHLRHRVRSPGPAALAGRRRGASPRGGDAAGPGPAPGRDQLVGAHHPREGDRRPPTRPSPTRCPAAVGAATAPRSWRRHRRRLGLVLRGRQPARRPPAVVGAGGRQPWSGRPNPSTQSLRELLALIRRSLRG